MNADAVLQRVARRAVVISAIFTAAGFVTGGFSAAVGVVGGALLALMSFLLLKRGMNRENPSGLGLILVRYALLALAAYVMIARLRLHPIGLLVGASSIAASIAVEAAASHHR